MPIGVPPTKNFSDVVGLRNRAECIASIVKYRKMSWMAAALGVSDNTVRRACGAYGLKFPTSPEAYRAFCEAHHSTPARIMRPDTKARLARKGATLEERVTAALDDAEAE